MMPKLKREHALKLIQNPLTQKDFVNEMNRFTVSNGILNTDLIIIRTKNQDFALQSIVFDKAKGELILDLSFIEIKS